MNFFPHLFKSKLDTMQAAAPRATLHLLHESNGFTVFLGEAAAAQKVSKLGVLTDYAQDVLLDDPVLHLFVPLEHTIKFVEEVTTTHSVALVDVILADKVHAARYVMYAYFPRKQATSKETQDWCPKMETALSGEKDPDADFWG